MRAVLVDARGRVWVGTSDAGVDILDPRTGRIEHLRHDASDAASLSSDRVFTLALVALRRCVDRHGQRASIAGSAELEARLTQLSRSLSGKQISRRARRPERRAVGRHASTRGLMRLDRDGRVLETFRHDAQRADSLSSDDVRALLEDQAGHLWVGTADGLDLLDRSTGSFTHYRHDANDADSLRDSFVMSLYQDQAGLVWIGTRTGGVSRWNPRSWELGGHRPDVARQRAGHRIRRCARQPRLDRLARRRARAVRYRTAARSTPLDALVGRRNALVMRA